MSAEAWGSIEGEVGLACVIVFSSQLVIAADMYVRQAFGLSGVFRFSDWRPSRSSRFTLRPSSRIRFVSEGRLCRFLDLRFCGFFSADDDWALLREMRPEF
jgi:hypothetical protein